MGKREGCLTGGISMGSALAMILSWDRSHSIFWAILHGILSWFYVIYYALTRTSTGTGV
jgi:hypothetical protein